MLGGEVWLAADPVLAPWQDLTDLRLTQTGAWILPDERALPVELEAFLEAGDPPIYAGFGSMAMRTSPDLAEVAIAAARALGRKLVLGRGWAELALDGEADDVFVASEVNFRRCSRALLQSCTTVARERPRPPPSRASRR